MDGGWIVLAELLLVLGGVVGWGVWELRKLARVRKARRARPPDADH